MARKDDRIERARVSVAEEGLMDIDKACDWLLVVLGGWRTEGYIEDVAERAEAAEAANAECGMQRPDGLMQRPSA